MDDAELNVAVLIADIVGSTTLYRSEGNAVALARISVVIDAMRGVIEETGGEFIHSKGDDVLCFYRDAGAAFDAAQRLLALPGNGVEIHIGLNYGPVIRARDDIFGDAVNIAARLASRANPGEALIGDTVACRLEPASRAALRLLGQMNLKGATAPMMIHKLSGADAGTETRFVTARSAPLPGNGPRAGVYVELRHMGMVRICRDGESVSIGRAPDSDLVIDRQWISRNHAVISNHDGKPRLVERSSSGTYLAMGGEREVFIRREEVMLVGEGRISPGMPGDEEGAEVIAFELVGRA
jgi:adenylate cyclase